MQHALTATTVLWITVLPSTLSSQVDEVAASLNSEDVFVLETPKTTFLWLGEVGGATYRSDYWNTLFDANLVHMTFEDVHVWPVCWLFTPLPAFSSPTRRRLPWATMWRSWFRQIGKRCKHAGSCISLSFLYSVKQFPNRAPISVAFENLYLGPFSYFRLHSKLSLVKLRRKNKRKLQQTRTLFWIH